MLILGKDQAEGSRRRATPDVRRARWRRCSATASTAASRSSQRRRAQPGGARADGCARSPERLGLAPRSPWWKATTCSTARRAAGGGHRLANLDTGAPLATSGSAGDGQRLPRRRGGSSPRSTPAPTSWSPAGSPTPRWWSGRPRGGTAGRATTGTRWPAPWSPGTSSSAAPQATGGNYSVLPRGARPRLPGLPDRRGRRRRLVASSPSTPAPAARSRSARSPRSCSTRSASPRTSNPDVVARFDTIRAERGRPRSGARSAASRGAAAAGRAQGGDERRTAATATR